MCFFCVVEGRQVGARRGGADYRNVHSLLKPGFPRPAVTTQLGPISFVDDVAASCAAGSSGFLPYLTSLSHLTLRQSKHHCLLATQGTQYSQLAT